MYVTKKHLLDPNDYELGEVIGTGAYGLVYKCTKKDTGEVFAAKQIKIDKEDVQGKEYFNREIGIMARISHPTIVKFYGYSIEEEKNNKLLLTIIMEFSKNGALEKVLKKIRKDGSVKNYDNTTRQKLLIGIARGMMYLHRHRIIFRDLKPPNILLDDNFQPLITDFGYAKIITTDSLKNTQTAGSLYTMAPEVMLDEKYNGKADVYSFGIVMFQIITDTMPFHEFMQKNPKSGIIQFINFVAQDGNRPIFPDDKPVKPALKELIERCWSNNPTERPTFEELFNKLAYNSDDSIYTDLFTKNGSYYLDDVDEDEILAYVDSIISDNSGSTRIINSINDLQKQITDMKAENRKKLKAIKTESKKIKQENNKLKTDRKEIINKISTLEKNFSEISQKVHPNTKSDNNFVDDDDDDDGEIVPVKKPSAPKQPKEFHFKKGSELDGIMRYLTKKNGGANICDKGVISISSDSTHQADAKIQFDPKNVVDFSNNSAVFLSDDKGGAFILFDFKGKTVKLSGYTLKSNNRQGTTSNLKNWALEVSNDNTKWTQLDKKTDNNDLNGPNRLASFKITKKVDGFFRYVRILQTGCSHYKSNNHNMFSISKVEFFGKLKE